MTGHPTTLYSPYCYLVKLRHRSATPKNCKRYLIIHMSAGSLRPLRVILELSEGANMSSRRTFWRLLSSQAPEYCQDRAHHLQEALACEPISYLDREVLVSLAECCTHMPCMNLMINDQCPLIIIQEKIVNALMVASPAPIHYHVTQSAPKIRE
jgi:hypothetical protein